MIYSRTEHKWLVILVELFAMKMIGRERVIYSDDDVIHIQGDVLFGGGRR